MGAKPSENHFLYSLPMKLARADVVNLNNILLTAGLAGIESIVIDGGLASGLNHKNAAFISNLDVPVVNQKIGISRLGILRQRLDLLTGNPDVYIDAKESERGEISQLEIVAGKTKLQFRCTSSALIKAPKAVNDPPVAIVSVSKDELQLFFGGIRALSTKQVSLAIKKTGEAIFSMRDATNDLMTIELTKPVEWLMDQEDVESVVHYFNTDILSTLLRASQTDDGIAFSVGSAGTINLLVHGHPMYIFSQIDGEE